MTTSQNNSPVTGETDQKPDVAQLQADIERTREDLAQTVDALTDKLDVKAGTRRRVSETRERAAVRVDAAKVRTREVTAKAKRGRDRRGRQAHPDRPGRHRRHGGSPRRGRRARLAPRPTMSRTTAERTDAPAPEDPAKPDSPSDLKKTSWGYVLKRTMREFSKDQCTDLAAALTYYAVLALFPAVIAVLSLLGLVGQGPKIVNSLLKVMSSSGLAGVAKTLGPTLEQLTRTPGAGVALVIGLLTALWSASGYVGSFGRAMNRIHEVEEGRPVWKLRPVMLVVTLVTVVLVALVLLGLVVSGPVAGRSAT